MHYIQKRYLFLCLSIGLIAHNIFSIVPLTSLDLSEEIINSLITEGKVTSTGNNLDAISLLPSALLNNDLLEQLTTIKAKSIIESLFLLPDLTGARQLKLYQALMDVYSLEGLEFYSRSEKKLKTLIFEAYLVDSFTSKQPVEPPKPNTIESFWRGTLVQDDETFGPKHYDIIIRANNDEILMTTQNLEKLTQGIITTAKPHEMLVAIYLIQTNQGLLIYQLMANAQGIPKMVQKKAYTSLFNRHEAYKNWIASIYPR